MLTRYRNRQGSSIVSNDTVESLPPERCRICLKQGDIPIFGEEDISEQIMEFGCIEVQYLDNLPQHLCDACHYLLESAILFRKTAKQSEELLKSGSTVDGASELSEDVDYSNTETYDTDNKLFIQREYLEYNDSSDSESDMEWKYKDDNDIESAGNVTKSSEQERKFENEIESAGSVTQSDLYSQVNSEDTDIQMQLVDVKVETIEDNDNDNELVMIIVSDKDKRKIPLQRCVQCDIMFDNAIQLQDHEKENHPELHFQKCEICQKQIDKNDYMEHIKEHRDKYKDRHHRMYRKVECEVCGKKINKAYYKYHIKMHGTPEEQAERVVECPICKKTFSSHYFSDHMKRVHDKKQKGEQTPAKKETLKPSEEETLLKCPVCDKMIGKSIYKEHLAKHGSSTRHYICDQCGKVFKHPSAFKTHMLTHGSELKYQCQFCPYRGLHLGLLKIHVRTHTGDYNYKCSECPARFITKSNLTKHLQRHQGICNYKCETCNKGFYSKRDVDKHYKTVHLDLKNNICDICGKGFGHRDNMLSHQLKVHKRKKITDKRGRIPTYLKEEIMKSSEDQ